MEFILENPRDRGLDEIRNIKIDRQPIICREKGGDKTNTLNWQSPKFTQAICTYLLGFAVAVWFGKFTWWPLEVVLKLWFETETDVLWHLKKPLDNIKIQPKHVALHALQIYFQCKNLCFLITRRVQNHQSLHFAFLKTSLGSWQMMVNGVEMDDHTVIPEWSES